MSAFQQGRQTGLNDASMLQSAAALGRTASNNLFGRDAPPPSLQAEAAALKTELTKEQAWRSIARAALAGVEAAVRSLPVEHRQAFEAAMAKNFDQAVFTRLLELGVDPAQVSDLTTGIKHNILGR